MLKEICDCLEIVLEVIFKDEEFMEGIIILQVCYVQEGYGFELIEIVGGYQFLIKFVYYNMVGIFLWQMICKWFLRVVLEIFFIIVYWQFIIKLDMEKIWGVSCDYFV